MLRYYFLFILYMSSLAALQSQVAITYCPDLKSDAAPRAKIGGEFIADISLTCPGYCPMQCKLGLLDPIGGYELGYYIYKDKINDIWAFHYELDVDAISLQSKIVSHLESNKHRPQGGKEGVHYLTVPRNEALTKIGDELQVLWESSKTEFKSWKTGDIPQGGLAKIFSKLEIANGVARLSLEFNTQNRVHEIYEAVSEQLFQQFPIYDRQKADDTTSNYFYNREFPSMRWAAYPTRGKMELTIQAPKEKNPPRLVFNFDQLRHSKGGTDTLVSIVLDGGKSCYVVAVKDESEVKAFRFGNQEITLQSIDSLLFAVVETHSDLNLREVMIRVSDEHGHEVSKKVFLLQHEADPPKFGLLDPTENIYKIPGDDVVLDKFGQRFELRGKVQDHSPIRAVRINKELVKLDENNLFTYALKPGDNNQVISVEIVDAHGNKAVDKFRLKFKESGEDRRMKQVVDEEFTTNNPNHLLRNGQDNLKLWIQDDRFYLQRLPFVDSSSSAESPYGMVTTEHVSDALVPLGIQALDFNSDFELNVSYKQVEPNSLFFFAFGINDSKNSYYFVYGERDNLFLGQMDNGVAQCLGEGCPEKAFNRVYSRYSYIAREPVKPNFFEQGTSVPYTLTIKRYNQFYLGALDDPQDYFFVKIDNGIDPAKEFRYKLSGGNSRITGSMCGFGLGARAFIGIDKFTYKKGNEKEASAFYDDKDAEKVCMETCYKVDPDKKDNFFDCLSDDYHAVIIANGSFDGGLNSLDSAVARGERLRNQLVQLYQFKEENVQFKPNMSKNDFINMIETQLPKRLTKKDKLLVYIISHGTADKHIAFSDGQVSSSYFFNMLNEKGQEPKYKCKQIVVVMDACYSGGMAPTQQQESNPSRLVCDAYNKGSRLLITSASKSPTKDSELTKAILNRLETYPERFLSIDKLFDQAGEDYNAAMQGTTRPTLTIFDPSANDPNGSFLFVKKKFYH
jgi:hypothetical protein